MRTIVGTSGKVYEEMDVTKLHPIGKTEPELQGLSKDLQLSMYQKEMEYKDKTINHLMELIKTYGFCNPENMRAVEALRIEVTKLQSEIKEQRAKEKELRMALGDTRAKLQEASRNFGVLKELADEYGYCRPELQIARMDVVEASQKIWQKTKAEVTDYFNEIEK